MSIAEKLSHVIEQKERLKTVLETDNNIFSQYPAEVEELKSKRDFYKGMRVTPTVSGSSIHLDDSVEYPIENMEVHGKNIVDQRLMLNASGWTVDSDSYYTGICSASGRSNLLVTQPKENTSYTISMVTYQDDDTSSMIIQAVYADGTNKQIRPTNTSPEKVSFVTDSTKTIISVSLTYAHGGHINHIKDLQVEEGTVATDYEPYSKDIDVIVCGKNLFPLDYSFNDSRYAHVITDVNMINFFRSLPVGETYAYSANATGTNENALRVGHLRLYSGGTYIALIDIGKKFTVFSKYKDIDSIYIYGSINGATLSNIQIEKGSVATEYEPYKSQSVTIDTESQTGWENLKTYSPVTNIIPSQSATIDVTYTANTQKYIENLELENATIEVQTMAELDQLAINTNQ